MSIPVVLLRMREPIGVLSWTARLDDVLDRSVSFITH